MSDEIENLQKRVRALEVRVDDIERALEDHMDDTSRFEDIEFRLQKSEERLEALEDE